MVKNELLRNRELETLTKSNPFGRICEPEEISSAILFLCSSQASYVSGIGMVIDGGLLAGSHA
jgi:NAD(P)-dependent dehydrogenase (short-subunit alcohol dehydrogenase family)